VGPGRPGRPSAGQGPNRRRSWPPVAQQRGERERMRGLLPPRQREREGACPPLSPPQARPGLAWPGAPSRLRPGARRLRRPGKAGADRGGRRPPQGERREGAAAPSTTAHRGGQVAPLSRPGPPATAGGGLPSPGRCRRRGVGGEVVRPKLGKKRKKMEKKSKGKKRKRKGERRRGWPEFGVPRRRRGGRRRRR